LDGKLKLSQPVYYPQVPLYNFFWGKLPVVPTAFVQLKSVVSLSLPEEVDKTTFFLLFKLKTLLCLCCAVVIYNSSMLNILWDS
jgi:hypothetical protein